MSVRTAISTNEHVKGAARRALPALAQARVAVLLGGRSSEREVSIVTGRQVLAALTTPEDGLDQRGPARVLAVEAREDGRWELEGEPLSVGRALERLAEVDVVFCALHGGEGENGTIQGLLASAGLLTTGSDVRASAVAMDKVFTRHLVASQGVRVARGECLLREDWEQRGESCLARCARWDAPGWVAKPRCGGSSIGAAVVRDPAELRAAVEAAFAWEPEVLVEELIEGVEVTCGVLVDPTGVARALPPIEIRPHPGRFFDYEEKYSAGGAQELCPPVSLAPAVVERVRALGVLVHRFLRCAGYSRSDFLVPANEAEPVFLELNTLPGLTPRSLVPLAAAREGIDYRTLCLWIVADALRRAGSDAVEP